MAMLNCPECNNQISNQATVCPKCGYPVNKKSSSAASGCLVIFISLIVISFLCVIIGSCPQNKSHSKVKNKISISGEDWKIIGSQGVAKFIFVKKDKKWDRELLAGILQKVVNKNSIQQVYFFDKENLDPIGFPMKDSQMLHWFASYKYNSNTNYEKFFWITITNPKTSPPEITEEEDTVSSNVLEYLYR